MTPAAIESKLATLPELVDTETVTKTETIEADTENGLMDDVADNVPTGSTDSTNLNLNAAELPTNLPDSLTNSPAAEHSGQESRILQRFQHKFCCKINQKPNDEPSRSPDRYWYSP